MSAERTAQSVLSRYHEEQQSIWRYSCFLNSKTTIRDEQVRELNRILESANLRLLPVRKRDRAKTEFSAAEIAALVNAAADIGLDVTKAIIDLQQALEAPLPTITKGRAARLMEDMNGWVDYFLEMITTNPDEDEIEYAIGQASMDYERDADRNENYLEGEERRRFFEVVIAYTVACKRDHQVAQLVSVDQQFEEIELLSQVARPDAAINVLRQSFLLLTTAFDAAVFDLMRIAFKKKFFPLVGIFGGNDRWSMKEMAEAGSFDVVQEQIIEEQLKKRYVKDLIGILAELGVKYVDEKAGDKYADLIEMIQRRNIHVHNRGVVDERYLETDGKSDKPKFNTYDLKLGEVACIDIAYMEKAYRLCGNCVFGLAQWVEKA